MAVWLHVLSWGYVAAQDSAVLASGTWYQIAVTQPGIYQITGKDLKDQGIPLSQVNPEQIQLYGKGGGMLPQSLGSARMIDPPENAIQVVGGEDGRFDETDYILFYGQSPDKLQYQLEEDQYQLKYEKNLYSDTVYYFLTFDRQQGKRIATRESVPGQFSLINTFEDYAAYEADLVNLLGGSGREWYGETLNAGENITLTFQVPGIADNTKLQLFADVLGKSVASSTVDVSLNGFSLGTLPVEPIVEGTYNEKGKGASALFETNTAQISGNDLSVNLVYQAQRGSAHLNKVWLSYSRKLQLYEQQTFFRSLGSTAEPNVTFQLVTPTSQVQVWDLTNPQNPVAQGFGIQGETLSFSVHTDHQLKEFVVFDTRTLPKPLWKGTVPSQDIKAGEIPHLLIVSFPGFVAEAERLAQFRQQHDHLTTKVVTTTQIYNEFSSGAQDITAIRNYVKYLYDQNPGQLKYLLLFGKSSYDYKNRVSNNTNFVPTYESRNATHPIYSYASDDYYGFMEEGEGVWEESFAGDHTLDIGVGRLPVKSGQEAKAVVDKLIRYSTDPSNYGAWRNEVLFVADDGDGDKHQQDAERLAVGIDTAYDAFNVRKVYLDVFPQESMPQGEIAPKANEAIQDGVKKGALIVNYTGHGNERKWAHETILNTEMIQQWTNQNKLPFFVTATCEFGRQDDPNVFSGAEQLVLHPQGGAIGMVTTARPVFSNSNFLLNEAFYQHVFQQREGQPLTLGEIFQYTKNDGLNGRVNRNFSLLADPSMRLAYPQEEIVIDSMWHKGAHGQFLPTDTLKAMSLIKMKGRVTRAKAGETLQDFNGTLYLMLYDKPVTIKTRGNEGTTMQFEERKSVIHRGKASIVQGNFEIELIIPKNIDYQYGQGKISAYAIEEGTAGRDAHGASIRYQIGGSSEYPLTDEIPPDIQLYMDDTTFIEGGYTSPNTTLIAYLQDESGINISDRGLGQNITAVLYQEQEESQRWVLNDFFVSEKDDFQRGVLTYPIENLPEGAYHLTLQVWDNANNQREQTLRFHVGDRLEIASFYNVPNPFQEQTSFTIDHNRAGDDLKVAIRILNLQGQNVSGFEKNYLNAPTSIKDMIWDGTDAEGIRVRPGMYLALLKIESLSGGEQKEKVQKIIILN